MVENNLPKKPLIQRVSELEGYTTSLMGNTCNLLAQLANTHSDMEDYLAQFKKETKGLINMSITDEVKSEITDTIQDAVSEIIPEIKTSVLNYIKTKLDEDGDEDVDVEDVKAKISKIKKKIDTNKNGKIETSEIKTAVTSIDWKNYLWTILLIAGVIAYIFLLLYDGQLIDDFMNGNLEGYLTGFGKVFIFFLGIFGVKANAKKDINKLTGLNEDKDSKISTLEAEKIELNKVIDQYDYNKEMEINKLTYEHDLEILTLKNQIAIKEAAIIAATNP